MKKSKTAGCHLFRNFGACVIVWGARRNQKLAENQYMYMSEHAIIGSYLAREPRREPNNRI